MSDTRDQDLKVIEAMKKYGGHFIKCLAEAAVYADSENLAKIKATWPEYWTRYQKFVETQDRLQFTCREEPLP